MKSKLPDVGVTIFTVMSKLAHEKGAINPSQGFPDFDVSSELIDRVPRHMRSGHNQYAPMQGVMALREAFSEKVARLYGAAYDDRQRHKVLRFCFAKRDDTLKEAAERLCRI